MMKRLDASNLTAALAGFMVLGCVLIHAGCGSPPQSDGIAIPDDMATTDSLSVRIIDDLSANPEQPSAPVIGTPPKTGSPTRVPASIPNAPSQSRKLGKVAYNTPDELIIGQSQVIEAQLAFDMVEIAENEFIGQGEVSSRDVMLSDRVRLSLVCTNDSKVLVKPTFDDPEQIIEDGKVSKWTWGVTAFTEGEKEFLLSVAVGTWNSNGHVGFSVQERTQFVIRTQAITWQDKTIGFVGEHWTWFASSIVIPLALFGFNRLRKIQDEPEGNG